MSVPAIGSSPALPAVPLPADVRAGGAEARDAYRTAAAFEGLLVRQLTEQLAASTGGEEPESAASQAYREQLPQALADGIAAAGGLGLADQLYRGFLSPQNEQRTP